jgi:hypothetical protein
LQENNVGTKQEIVPWIRERETASSIEKNCTCEWGINSSLYISVSQRLW